MVMSSDRVECVRWELLLEPISDENTVLPPVVRSIEIIKVVTKTHDLPHLGVGTKRLGQAPHNVANEDRVLGSLAGA